MTIHSPVEPDWQRPGQPVLVGEDPEMTRRGYAGREGKIESLCGRELPGMAMVTLKDAGRTTPTLYVILPLANLTPIRRTAGPSDSD